MKAFADHLAQGQVKEAKEVLNNAKDNLEPSIYWFNMGLADAKLEQWAQARISLLKSQKISARNETNINLEIVEGHLAVSEYESPQTIKDYGIQSTYFVGTQLALTINLALLVIGLWNYNKKKKLKEFIIILCLMLGLSALSIWTKNWPWYVASNEVAIYHGPSALFDQKGVIPKGIKILGKEKDNWIQVIYPSRLEGWIKKELISEL